MANDTRNQGTQEPDKPRVLKPGEKAKPGEPGYYNPPTIPSVTRQQNAPEPQGAAATADFPPEQPKPEQAADQTPEGQVDYNDMTVAELKDLAHKRGVEIHSDMLKDDIIKALKKSE